MGCLFSAIKLVFKGIGYFLYYTLPIILCAVGVIGGIFVSGITMSQDQKKYLNSLKEDATHTVTIYWDQEGTLRSELKVREDINWNINGILATVTVKSTSDDLPYYYDVFVDADKKVEDGSITQFQFDRSGNDVYHGKFDLPAEAEKEGWKFLGLFTTPFGGTQFVNGAGYSLRDVTMDLVLYAVWQEL